jgi:hypothetical protein
VTRNELEKLKGFVKRWTIYEEDFPVSECLNQLSELLDQLPIVTCICCGKECDIKTILCEYCKEDDG